MNFSDNLVILKFETHYPNLPAGANLPKSKIIDELWNLDYRETAILSIFLNFYNPTAANLSTIFFCSAWRCCGILTCTRT